jgi:hypothetical protein
LANSNGKLLLGLNMPQSDTKLMAPYSSFMSSFCETSGEKRKIYGPSLSLIWFYLLSLFLCWMTFLLSMSAFIYTSSF